MSYDRLEKFASKKLAKIVIKLVEMPQARYDRHSDCYDDILFKIEDEMSFRKAQDASEFREEP